MGLSSSKSGNGGGGWAEIRRQRRPLTIEHGQDARGGGGEGAVCVASLRER
jgi:hypothetical protein